MIPVDERLRLRVLAYEWQRSHERRTQMLARVAAERSDRLAALDAQLRRCPLCGEWQVGDAALRAHAYVEAETLSA